MRRIFILFLLLTACVQPTVVRVIDGDTVRLADGRTMRLAGIDCPESKANVKCRRDGASQCDVEVIRGQSVAQEVRTLLADGTARAEVLDLGDRYGRALGYVWLADGRDLGQWLIATGRCADWSARYPHPRQAFYGAP